jgi:lipopolysaccharide transport system ATP-binding protein
VPALLTASGVGKRFRRYHADRPATLKELFLRGAGRRAPAESFWALRNVSLEVGEGQTLGVIGANGAGKSTLLRLLGGIGRPDEGSISVHGRIGGLLDLGAGFHPDLTGRENVFVSGVVNGLLRREVAERFESIIDFAQLEDFIDSPLRTYSTGMQMRLGFALAMHSDPRVLLVDEILAVGDVAFQRRCLQRIADFKAAGTAIVLVSHEPNLIRDLCDEVLWLRHGQPVALGAADVVVAQYLAEMSSETRRRTPSVHPLAQTPSGLTLRVHENRFGSMEMEITAVRILDADERPSTCLRSGDAITLDIDYLAPRSVAEPIFGVTIEREDGVVCYESSTASAGLRTGDVVGQGRVRLTLDRLDLNGGVFRVSVGAYHRDWSYAYDYHWRGYSFTVDPPVVDKGVLRPPARWTVGPGRTSSDARSVLATV